MDNRYWAKRVDELAEEALQNGANTTASALKSLAGSLFAGVDKEFMNHCTDFSRAMIEELKRLNTSQYN